MRRDDDRFVVLVDDERSVLAALETILAKSGWNVLSYDSASAFLAEFDPERRGCLVLDLRMPGTGGLALQQKLIELDSSIPIVFVTGHVDIPSAVRALQRGAVDLLQKPFRKRELLEAVGRAMERDVVQRSKQARCSAMRQRIGKLTPRERQVLQLVAAGRLNKQIASELGISERTVEVHRHRGMKKLGVNSAVALLRLVLESMPPEEREPDSDHTRSF